MTRQRMITGGLWLAAAAAGAAGWRVHRTVYPAALAVAAVATAVTLTCEITTWQVDRQGDRITDVILARLETGPVPSRTDHLAARSLRAVRLA